jgi:hypothetical protein
MSAMFVETITAPINNNTIKPLDSIDLENINNYFEIVYGDKPMRPYIDIDGVMNNIDNEHFNNLDLQILDKLSTLNDCSIMTSSKYACMDKNDVVNKLSYRLTFYNEICKDKKDCKNYIQSVKLPFLQKLLRDIIDISDKKNDNCLNVDLSVYRTKGKIRCVNAYKTHKDKTRINKLIKGNIEQTIIYANNMDLEIETKGEPINSLKNEIIIPVIKPNKKINNIQQKINKLQEQMNNEITKVNNDELKDFYNSYFLNDLLNSIDINKIDHTDWIKVVLSFKKCDGVFEDLIEWNQHHRSFNLDGLTSIWNQYTDDENEMSIGTLMHIAETTNKRKYNLWKTIIFIYYLECNFT